MKFVLVHGAADQAASWDEVAAALRGRGHDVVAVDLPCEDDWAGLEQYADTVLEAIGSDRDNVAVVGHSLGGYTATLVADRVAADLLVLVTAMVPRPGETPMEFWADTGHHFGSDDIVETYLADATPEQVERALALGRDQSGTPMGEPFPLDAWPDVPTRYLVCTRDNFNPADWTRAMVRDRLGIEADEIDAGHCPYITRPTSSRSACTTTRRVDSARAAHARQRPSGPGPRPLDGGPVRRGAARHPRAGERGPRHVRHLPGHRRRLRVRAGRHRPAVLHPVHLQGVHLRDGADGQRHQAGGRQDRRGALGRPVQRDQPSPGHAPAAQPDDQRRRDRRVRLVAGRDVHEQVDRVQSLLLRLRRPPAGDRRGHLRVDAGVRPPQPGHQPHAARVRDPGVLARRRARGVPAPVRGHGHLLRPGDDGRDAGQPRGSTP